MHSPLSPDVAQPAAGRSELRDALISYRGAFVAVACFSGVINVLMLSGSLFMLQVYDRVLPSRSVPTLVALIILVAVLYAFQGVLELHCGRVCWRASGHGLDERSQPPRLCAIIRLPLKPRAAATGCSPCATSTRCAASFRAAARRRYSICRGCRSTWRSALRSIPGSASRRSSAALLLLALTILTDRMVRGPTKA